MHMEEIEDAEFSFMKDRRCLQRETDASENIRHYDQSLRWRIRRFFEKRNSIDLLRISTSNGTLLRMLKSLKPYPPKTRRPPRPLPHQHHQLQQQQQQQRLTTQLPPVPPPPSHYQRQPIAPRPQ
uniref:Uncharacterized protein n=1 Tax=Anopheles christyi TaxID=43041 RepID=A0A182JUQ5_9DIPT